MSERRGWIETQNLSRRFGKLTAVKSLDLSIAAGEIYGLIGPDGAGKTTTLRMLAGVMKPSGGTVRVNGLDLRGDAERLRREIGYMAQRFSLYGDLSVRENMEFFADLFGVRGREREERIGRLLQFARLEQFQDRDADALSGGMKKKLGLACALVHRPQVLLLDEPTNGVDPISRREFWDILSDLHIEGVTIVVSTAYMDEAERCSRVGLIYQGEVVREGPPGDLRQLVRGELLVVETIDLARAEELVRGLEGVEQVQIYGDRLHLFVDNVAARLPQVQAALEARGVRVMGIRPGQPRLEEAFISLVMHP